MNRSQLHVLGCARVQHFIQTRGKLFVLKAQDADAESPSRGRAGPTTTSLSRGQCHHTFSLLTSGWLFSSSRGVSLRRLLAMTLNSLNLAANMTFRYVWSGDRELVCSDYCHGIPLHPDLCAETCDHT